MRRVQRWAIPAAVWAFALALGCAAWADGFGSSQGIVGQIDARLSTLGIAAGADITGVTAGTGLSGGGTSGSVTLSVSDGLDDIAAITTVTADGTILVLVNDEWQTLAPGTDTYVLTRDTTAASGLAWAAAAGGVGGSTGATDNAILVADGVGGATLKSSGMTVVDGGVVTTMNAPAGDNLNIDISAGADFAVNVGAGGSVQIYADTGNTALEVRSDGIVAVTAGTFSATGVATITSTLSSLRSTTTITTAAVSGTPVYLSATCGGFVAVDASVAGDLYLPDPATVGNGAMIELKDVGGDATVNPTTIRPFAAETIDGAASHGLDVNYESVTLIVHGGNWYVR